jgi:FKBP-type peptidyl-prolyl cis-trans isomerase 2
MWVRKGVKLLEEQPGYGAPVEHQQNYLLAIRITLNRGEVIRHPEKCLSYHLDKHLKTDDDGYFRHHVRINRENLVAGIFYAVQGLNVGGCRKVTISPHLAYGERGIKDIIPPNAKLTVELKDLEKVE